MSVLIQICLVLVCFFVSSGCGKKQRSVRIFDEEIVSDGEQHLCSAPQLLKFCNQEKSSFSFIACDEDKNIRDCIQGHELFAVTSHYVIARKPRAYIPPGVCYYEDVLRPLPAGYCLRTCFITKHGKMRSFFSNILMREIKGPSNL